MEHPVIDEVFVAFKYLTVGTTSKTGLLRPFPRAARARLPPETYIDDHNALTTVMCFGSAFRRVLTKKKKKTKKNFLFFF